MRVFNYQCTCVLVSWKFQPAKFFAVTEERTITIRVLRPSSVTERLVHEGARSFVVIGFKFLYLEALLHDGRIIESRNQMNPAILAKLRYAVQQHHFMLAEGCMFDVLAARPFFLR